MLAFKIIKYLLDGMIDGVITVDDIEKMRINGLEQRKTESDLECKRVFKTKHGLNIHVAKLHGKEEKKIKKDDVLACKKCKLNFADAGELTKHTAQCGSIINLHRCEFCGMKRNLKYIERRVMKKSVNQSQKFR